jgi:hypothetical protein
LPEKFSDIPCVRCPPEFRSRLSIVSPGWSTDMYAAMLAWLPE